MGTHLNWGEPKIAQLTLKETYQQINLDQPEDIPWIIKLFENPCSPFALPGNITLHNHDCLHIILGKSVTPQDEAFVIGVTMGSDTKTKFWHVQLFKFLSRFIYPLKYRFNYQELKIFDLGFKYGKNFCQSNLHLINFNNFYDYKINTIRALLGIDLNIINRLSYSKK